jgi:NAD(P)-dependent dehydrogenase (short-subunit alcohol dehydrogenase family)
LNLEGKSIVVTGAGGGIGRDFALAMAAAGASVLVNDIGTSVKGEGRDAGPAQQVVNLIREQGGIAVASTDSVAEWESANRIVQAALDAFGRLAVVVLHQLHHHIPACRLFIHQPADVRHATESVVVTHGLPGHFRRVRFADIVGKSSDE